MLNALTDSNAYRPDARAGQPVEAVIAATVTSVDGDVWILTPGAKQRTGPCRWMPRANNLGAVVFPQRDDPCTVVTSNNGHHHLVWWRPA